MIQKNTKKIFEKNKIYNLYDKIEKGTTNIFIISNILELLSAIEAQHKFKTKNNILILFFSDTMHDNEINELLLFTQLFPYSQLVGYKYDHKTCFRTIINLIPKLKYNYFFSGNIYFMENKWLNKVNYNILYMLIDNPYDTIYINEVFKKKNVNYYIEQLKSAYHKRSHDKLYFFKKLQSNRIIKKNLKKIKFFTRLNFNFNHKNIVHNYKYVSNLISHNSIFKDYEIFFHKEIYPGHIELINLKEKNSIENNRYITSNGVQLYIYPTAIEDILYQQSIKTFLENNEKVYNTQEDDNDVLKIRKLQLTLIYFDPKKFEIIINEIITNFMSRILTFTLDDIKRYIWILNATNQLMRFLFYATNYFILHKGYFIEVISFYTLFDRLTSYYNRIETKISEKEKDKILTEFVWIFSHYAKRASRFNDVKNINSYLYLNKDIFENKLIYVLLYSSSYCYYEKDCEYEQLLNNTYDDYINNKLYNNNLPILLDTLKIANFSGKNIDNLCLTFLSDKVTISPNINIEILQNILESTVYYQLAMDELWLIHKDLTLNQKYRRNAGFLLIESYRKIGNIQKSKILYLKMFLLLPPKTRNDAIRYIDQLEPLGLFYSHQYIFKYLYINFIAIPFFQDINVDLTRSFLLYQFMLSKLDKLKDLNIIYQKRFRPKVLELIKTKTYTKILYINPSDEYNNGLFPIHIYDKLLDNNILIQNIEEGNINFFNDYIDPNLPTLRNQNNSITNINQHWNQNLCEWVEKFEDNKLICNKINIYQGVFEYISRWQKRYSVDFNSLTTKMLWSFFKRIIDKNLYIIDYCIKYTNVPIGFLSITSHYPPWSMIRDMSLQLNNTKLSFIHVSPTYENYVHNMKNDTLSTITALNLTKYKHSRIAGFGASELFLKYIQKEYKNIILPSHVTNNLVEKSTGQYIDHIKEARKNGKTIICLLGKIVYDLAVPNMNGTFTDMKSWVQETIEFVLRRDDIFVLIKPHPHEINFSISQYPNESFLDFVNIKSPNIYLMGHHEAGLDKLINQIDAFILWNGTSVLELAHKKQNIIVCDDWAKKDYPIDLYQPLNKNDYFNSIINAKQWNKNSDIAIHRQKLAYLYVQYMKNGSFFVNNPGVIRSSTNIDWNNTYINMSEVFSEFKKPTQNWYKLLKLLEHE